MQKRALWTVGAIEEFAKVWRNGAGEVMFVGLAEEEASPRRGFEELGCQQAAKAVEKSREG